MKAKQLVVLCFIHTKSPRVLEKAHELEEFCRTGGVLTVIDCREDVDKEPIKPPFESIVVIEKPHSESDVQCCNTILLQHCDLKQSDYAIIDESILLDVKLLTAVHESLRSFDRYAFASPRINCGELFSLPENYNTSTLEKLPPLTRTPNPSPAYVVARGDLLILLGGFDDAFQSIPYALTDAALKANCFGFDSIMCNRIVQAGRFGPCLPDITADRTLLSERHDSFNAIQTRYASDEIDPCDHFLKILSLQSQERPKVLLEFSNLPPFHCGTSEYQMALLKYFDQCFSEKYEIHVFTNEAGARFHQLEKYYKNIHYSEDDLQVYHVGLFAAQPVTLEQQILMNSHCLKTIYTMLDVIMLRCNYILNEFPSRSEIVRYGLARCDGIISISKYSQKDYLQLFQGDERIQKKRAEAIYIATDFGINPSQDADFKNIPFEDYVLIAGNPYRHKALTETINSLRKKSVNYVVVGYKSDGFIKPNIYSFTTSLLSEGFLEELYSKCSAFIFPSLYEGFGLPITMALRYGKNVIVYRNELNEELQDLLPDLTDHFTFFDDFTELDDVIECTLKKDELPSTYTCTWKETVVEIERFMQSVIKAEFDPSELRARWHDYRLLSYQLKNIAPAPIVQDDRSILDIIDERFLEGHPARKTTFKALKPLMHVAKKIVR